jgi:hypothetical protein
MALIITSVTIFFDKTDSEATKKELLDSFVAQRFSKLSEAKDPDGSILAYTFQNVPQMVMGKNEAPNVLSDNRKDNIFKFNPAGGMK